MKYTQSFLTLLIFTVSFQFSVFAQANEFDTLITKLFSQNQATRDSAALKLRQTYQPSKRSLWDDQMKDTVLVKNKSDLKHLFAPLELKVEFMLGDGQTHMENYRLNDDWIISCSFENKDDELLGCDLIANTRDIWFSPEDSNFTGTWITYYINGQKAREIEYKNGRYFGKFISYHSNGSVSYIQHYTEKGCHGPDTGYYPTGKIQYKAQYKNGKAVGVWKWFDEDGNVTSTKEHDD